MVVRQGDRLRIERVRFDDIGAGLQILPVNVLNNCRLGEVQKVVVALQILFPIFEPLATKGRFIQLPLLDHRTHRSVENQNSLLQ